MTGTGNVFVSQPVCRLRHHPTGEYNGCEVLLNSKRPTHEAFVVTGEGESAFWTKIGAAWPPDDGKGFNVELIALPVSGRLVIRERKELSK